MTDYETFIDDVIDKLEDTIQACASFTADNTHFDYVRTEDFGDEDPICLVHLVRDSVDDEGPKETHHTLTFEAKITHPGTGSRTTLNEIVSYVDEIVTQIEASRTLGSTYVERSEVTNVEYSTQAQQSYVLYHAVITIVIEGWRTA